jgi:hypothetical protein
MATEINTAAVAAEVAATLAVGTAEEKALVERIRSNLAENLAALEAYTVRGWVVGFDYGLYFKEGSKQFVSLDKATVYRSSTEAQQVAFRTFNGTHTRAKVFWSEAAKAKRIPEVKAAIANWDQTVAG